MAPMSSTNPSFSDLTTIGVGGRIARFVEPRSREAMIDTLREADRMGSRLCVLGGGSNLLVSDEAFDGVVVRDARRAIEVLETRVSTAGPVHDDTVQVRAQAGCHWDDFVSRCIAMGLAGVEGLSGIPGTVGASVVQNIGAYGQEVSTSVDEVEVWDRLAGRIARMSRTDMRFGYRVSALKRSMLAGAATPSPTSTSASVPVPSSACAPDVAVGEAGHADYAGRTGRNRFFPSPRYIVLSVTFLLRRDVQGVLGYGQLASALHAEVGDRMPTAAIRAAVLAVRAAKGMLEDAHRYEQPFMRGVVDESNLRAAVSAQSACTGSDGPDYDRHSCGSFFMNPVLTPDEAATLPPQAPRFPARDDAGREAVKTSAAWLIDHAGFHKGFSVGSGATASLSTRHTLALTNRGGARAADVERLARAVQEGVQARFGVHLVPEPVVVGLALA